MINKKNLIIIITLIIAIFSISRSASADTYIYHTCNDLGIVTATVDIQNTDGTKPAGPFTIYAASNFYATGFIISSCGARNMNLTAENNDSGIVAPLVPLVGTEVFIYQGMRYPGFGYNSTLFQSPAGTARTFRVHFVLGVNEPDPEPWYNTPWTSPWIQRSNCPAPFEGAYGTYTVGSHYFSSTISQADADNQAQMYGLSQMQSQVNASAKCGYRLYRSIPGDGIVMQSNVCFTYEPFFVEYPNTDVRGGTGAVVYDHYGYAGMMGNKFSGTVVGYGNYIMTILNGSINVIYNQCP